MNNCPICSKQLLTRLGSAGEDTWCSGCRRVIVSSSLGLDFKTAMDDIQQCAVDGIPGWKGPAADAKCYIYEPGNPESESQAQSRARASAYSTKRESYVRKFAESAFEGPVPEDVIDGTLTRDRNGVTVNPLGNQNQMWGLASRQSSNTEGLIDIALGRGYCTACGGDHDLEHPCPLTQI